jgi:NADH-quinone oxidoreductase subunit A
MGRVRRRIAEAMSDQLKEFVPVGLLILAAAGFAAVNLLAPWLIGKRRVHDPVKDTPYECGMPPMSEAHTRFSVKFYLVAMLFILFDIEVVFFLGWSAVFRDLAREIGWEMFAGGALFLAILEVGHIYAWKRGALDWAPKRPDNADANNRERPRREPVVAPTTEAVSR